MISPISRSLFIGIEHVAHLAAGGEAPVLRSHVDAATRYLLDKGDGMPGRERFFTVVGRARERLASGNPPFLPLYLLENARRTLDDVDGRAIEAHVLVLGGELRRGLVKLGLPVLTPEAPETRAGNIVFATDRSRELEQRLRAAGVLTWSGDGRLRISVHGYNDEGDVARALDALARLST